MLKGFRGSYCAFCPTFALAGTEGRGFHSTEMTESTPPPSRFVVRKSAVRGKWMVWDRQIRGPAKMAQGRYATGLSEHEAHQLKGQLDEDS
jgi:hypothetical protein